MNINDTYNASKANVVLAQAYSRQMASASTEGTKENSKFQKALESADLRIKQKTEVTSDQISSLAKLKSSFADTQSAARDVQKLKPEASTTDIAGAAEKLVAAYNGTIKAATTVDAPSASSAEAVNARRAGSDLRRNVSAEGLSTELQKAGVSQNSDGTLKIDAEKFKAAASSDSAGLRKALEKVGQKMEASSSKALADNGNLNTTLNTLKERELNLGAQQAGKSNAANLNANKSAMAAAYKNNAAASPAEITAKADKLVNAYNEALKTASNKDDLLISDKGELAAELKKAGISQNSDGTLKIDAEKLKASVSGNTTGVRWALEKANQKLDANGTGGSGGSGGTRGTAERRELNQTASLQNINNGTQNIQLLMSQNSALMNATYGRNMAF